MMDLKSLLQQLWNDYSGMNKQAGVIHTALEKRGEQVINDHVAFRTFDIPETGIDALAEPFVKLGYRKSSENYHFPEKKLIARHFEHSDPKNPKIFISALQIQECSPAVHAILKDLTSQLPKDLSKRSDFLVSGTPWEKISWKTYQDLLKESEYAAWMAAFGFRVNHFTVFFNSLKTFQELSQLNEFIKSIGFELNAVGGEVKGSKAVYLEQSSTLAYPVQTAFADKTETVPGCYYEFARRYPMPDGKLFQGFIPDSANKIFESTNYRKNPT